MRRNIRKILFVTLWCLIGAGVLVLLGAAIKSRNNNTCKGWKIGISSASESPFVDRNEVLGILTANGSGKWQGRPLISFDLRGMESSLERNVWISDAQLFFDNNQVLQVKVIERVPVARIFTNSGESFYMDSSGKQIPLSDRFSARLPVFTGYPLGKIRQHGVDSALTVQIKRLSRFIGSDPFWMSQLSQIAITPDRNFEMVPVVGNHVIVFGDGNDYEQKFHRLFVFYREVLSKTGFDKYARIDVQYEGQVIGTRKEAATSRYDSLLALRNIEQLIRTARQLQADTVSRQDTRPLERSTITEQNLTNYDMVPEKGENEHSSPEPIPEADAAHPPLKKIPALNSTAPLKKPLPSNKPPLNNPVSANGPNTERKRTLPGNPIPVKNSGPMKKPGQPKNQKPSSPASSKNPGSSMKKPAALAPGQQPKAVMPKKPD